MKKLLVPLTLLAIVTSSCVSKKKYAELEKKYYDTQGNLQQLEVKFEKIENRVTRYNEKINSLKDVNASLQEENETKLDMVGNVTVMSKATKKKMLATLAKVDPKELEGAETLKDSLSIAVAYNLKNKINTTNLDENEDINVNIDQTVVMISVSDKMLFNSGSARVSSKADKVLRKLADIINSEPSMDVMIEGHTDSQSINTACIQDNWDLSVKRATSIVRTLEKKYNVAGNRLIASGRGSTMPLVDNDSRENRARNRRTRIVILPNLDKFFALMDAEEKVLQP